MVDRFSTVRTGFLKHSPLLGDQVLYASIVTVFDGVTKPSVNVFEGDEGVWVSRLIDYLNRADLIVMHVCGFSRL
jgi:hypothetical protein